MAGIFFSWELGGGLGHAGSIKPLAEEMIRRGHRVSLGLRDLVHTDVLLSGIEAPRHQAPVWLHRVHGVPSPPASMAEILMACGYLNADALRGLFVGWRNLLMLLRPDLLVADYSPTAILAARSLGIPSVATGPAFFIPPVDARFPCIRDWEQIPAGRLDHAERSVTTAANTVLTETGAPPIAYATSILGGDHALLLSWPELDPYGRETLPEGMHWWGPSMLQSGGEFPAWPGGKGKKVFAYLKSAHPDHELVLKALVALGCSVVCYLPELASGRPPPVSASCITYCNGPADLARVLPECDLCVCHGGAATVAQSLLCGIPLFLLPMQGEQFLVARRIGRLQLGLNAAERPRPVDYAALLSSVLEAPEYGAAAESFAARHAGFSSLRHTQSLADEFERILRVSQ